MSVRAHSMCGFVILFILYDHSSASQSEATAICIQTNDFVIYERCIYTSYPYVFFFILFLHIELTTIYIFQRLYYIDILYTCMN